MQILQNVLRQVLRHEAPKLQGYYAYCAYSRASREGKNTKRPNVCAQASRATPYLRVVHVITHIVKGFVPQYLAQYVLYYKGCRRNTPPHGLICPSIGGGE